MNECDLAKTDFKRELQMSFVLIGIQVNTLSVNYFLCVLTWRVQQQNRRRGYRDNKWDVYTLNPKTYGHQCPFVSCDHLFPKEDKQTYLSMICKHLARASMQPSCVSEVEVLPSRWSVLRGRISSIIAAWLYIILCLVRDLLWHTGFPAPRRSC